jgi:hypothetical protein
LFAKPWAVVYVVHCPALAGKVWRTTAIVATKTIQGIFLRISSSFPLCRGYKEKKIRVNPVIMLTVFVLQWPA